MAALGALKSIKKAGLKIPEDIAVIGYSDWQFCSLVNPSLSSVSQPGYEMGKEACKLIFKEINKTNIEKSTIKILDTEVVVRESSNKLGVIQPLAN